MFVNERKLKLDTRKPLQSLHYATCGASMLDGAVLALLKRFKDAFFKLWEIKLPVLSSTSPISLMYYLFFGIQKCVVLRTLLCRVYKIYDINEFQELIDLFRKFLVHPSCVISFCNGVASKKFMRNFINKF